MNNFDAIEDYINGDLSGQDRIAFETRLKTDIDLQKDYQDWVNTENILKKHLSAQDKTIQLKSTLQPLTKKYFSSQKPEARLVSIKSAWLAAAAVAAIFIIYFSLPGGVYHFSTPEMPQAIVRGDENLANKGALLFNEGHYNEALPLLQQQAIGKPDDATANYFYAVCLVKTDRYEEALPLFLNLSKGVSAYKVDASFFAAYAAYKTNKKEDALKYAKMVPENNPYFKNAKKIIQKLN